jgi:hypothetical protein
MAPPQEGESTAAALFLVDAYRFGEIESWPRIFKPTA